MPSRSLLAADAELFHAGLRREGSGAARAEPVGGGHSLGYGTVWASAPHRAG